MHWANVRDGLVMAPPDTRLDTRSSTAALNALGTSIVTDIVVPRPRCRPDLTANLPHQLRQLVIIVAAIVFLGNFDKLSQL